MIETERLLLRRWRDDDIVPFAVICADPDVMKWIADGQTRSVTQTTNSIRLFEEEWEAEGFGLFAVELKSTGDLIGFTGLSIPTFLPEILPAVEIGWRLGRSYWGHGYASEAAHAALAFGQSDMGLEKIVSICLKGNDASERVMLKLGMTFDRQTVEPTYERTVKVYRTC